MSTPYNLAGEISTAKGVSAALHCAAVVAKKSGSKPGIVFCIAGSISYLSLVHRANSFYQ